MICNERNSQDDLCRGQVTVERDGDWLTYRCATCETERARHARTADPDVKRQSRLERAGLAPRFVGQKLEKTEENKSVLFALGGWVDDYRKGDPLPAPALYGQAGRGKSHTLTMLCLKLIRDCDAAVMYRSARGLLREFQQFEDGAEQAWERATTVDVLALDDFGAQQMTDWRHDQIADLVDARYEAERPIVLATNFAPSTWRQAMDERTASRLRGMTFSLVLSGPDRRQLEVQTTTEGAAA